jgi:hypothetical protein
VLMGSRESSVLIVRSKLFIGEGREWRNLFDVLLVLRMGGWRVFWIFLVMSVGDSG